MGTTKIIILGGKGTAVNIAEAIYDANKRFNEKIEFLGFAFDDETIGDSINGFPVLCGTMELMEKYSSFNDVKFIFQLNHQEKMRERGLLAQSYNIPPEKWFTFIHPSAYVAKSAKIGFGSVIFAHCAVHSNANIGNHCTFSASTTIGHDTIVGDHVFTATHVCIGSDVRISKYSFFGQNTTVKSGVKINENNLIGLGASVINDIYESNKVIIGTPAKAIKSII
jgi:acetyltransferase EpsM